MTVHTGRHFLQIPGPTNVPDRVLRAMDMPTIDHRGPEFAELGFAVLAGMQRVFRTKQPVVIYPSSGTGAWEAALVNTFVARRQGADVRDRPVRRAVARHRRQVRARRRLHAGRLAPRRRPGADREAPCAPTASTRSRRSASSTTRPRPGVTAASPRSARRSTAQASGAADGRHDLRRSARSTTATTSGASTSRSPARRRA